MEITKDEYLKFESAFFYKCESWRIGVSFARYQNGKWDLYYDDGSTTEPYFREKMSLFACLGYKVANSGNH